MAPSSSWSAAAREFGYRPVVRGSDRSDEPMTTTKPAPKHTQAQLQALKNRTKGNAGTFAAAVDWVAQNMVFGLKDVVDDCPNLRTYNLLVYAKSDPNGFHKTIATKAAQADAGEDSAYDDSEKSLDELRRMLRESQTDQPPRIVHCPQCHESFEVVE